MRIFLAPRSNETSYKNFLSTIDSGVDYSVVEPHLDDEGKKILGGKGKLYVWGNKETKKGSWDKMEPGDLILFYKGREGEEKAGKFLYAGTLLYKQHSKALGLALWPPKPKEEPWPCVFFLDNLKPIYIPIAEIIEMAGYESNFIVYGFMPLNEQGTKHILEKYGTFDKFLAGHSTKPEEQPSDLEETNEINAHADAQLLLLKIGKLLGYDTYSPNKSSEAFGEKLEDYCTLPQMPTRFLGELAPIIKQIDVIWLKDEVPKYAFEIEHTTKFGSGFQRLYQLNALATKLFIVASQKDYPLFEKFIETDPYYKYKKNFHFRNYKQLE